MKNFAAITELPGVLLNQEQMARIVQRYQLGAQLARSKRVLEVSCGAGSGLGMLQQTAQTLVACDYTFSILTMAQSHYGARVPLVCADAQQLPFASESFDLVISCEAIYYLAQIDWFLREAHRLLAAGGRLMIVTSNPDWPYFVPGAMSVYYPTVPDLAAYLSSAGFVADEWYGAMDVHGMPSRRHALASLLRKWVLRAVSLDTAHGVLQRLKQLAYGPMETLPAELLVPLQFDIRALLTPIDGTTRDYTHRVIFVVASRKLTPDN